MTCPAAGKDRDDQWAQWCENRQDKGDCHKNCEHRKGMLRDKVVERKVFKQRSLF